MISVIIPVLNESETIPSVIAFARRSPGVNQVLVIDDGSVDGTPELARAAGATVLTSSLLGKGASMEDGLWAARNDTVVYLDGDLYALQEDLIPRLTAPLHAGQADLVKASFSRRSGRVTTLTAKPLLATFFPELAHFDQPLGGIIAGNRSFLRNLTFETDYGVDIALLLDAVTMGGRVVEVNVGHIEHDSQPLDALGEMARQVVRVILDRAARYGRLHPDQIREVEELERRTKADLSVILQKAGQPEKLALFDMDGVLLRDRFIVALARRTNKTLDLADYLDRHDLSAEERTRAIASLFEGVPRDVFEQTARTLPLIPGAVDTVIELRKLGYRVGVVTDSYRIVAEIVRRRVFADFSISHLMRFRRGVATGEVTLSSAMLHPNGCSQHLHCKLNAMQQLAERMGIDPAQILAVGDGENDICMLRAAGRSIAFEPKTPSVAAAAQHLVEGDLTGVLAFVPDDLFARSA